MVDDTVYKGKTKIERVIFSVRLRGIFFPLGFSDIVQLINSSGFTLIGPLRERPSVPSGAQLVVAGRIAEKGDLKLNVDPERGIMNVEGKSIQDVLTEFDGIEKLALSEFGVNFNAERRFYETIGDLTILADKDPIATISKIYSDSKVFPTFNTILKEDTGNYGIRLVKKGQAPDQEEWWEYRIDPLVAKSRSTYYSNVIYRSEDKANVVRASREMVERVEQLIMTMEQL